MQISHRFETEFCDRDYRTITQVHSATVEDIVWCIVNGKEVHIFGVWPDFKTITGFFTKIDASGVHFKESATGQEFVCDAIGEPVEWVEADT